MSQIRVAKLARDQADDQMIHEAIIVHHDFRDLLLTSCKSVRSKYTEALKNISHLDFS